MLKVKICGITRPGDALAAAAEGADYIGLIFAPSPRRIDARAARDILRDLPPKVEAVGVFKDQPLDEVRDTLDAAGLKIAQLHGDESPDYARRLARPFFKVFDACDDSAPKRFADYDALAFLLDLPKGSGEGSRIDPDRALRARRLGRVILAGRLTPATVGDLVARVRPYGVDCCAGTEKSPGVKDRAKVRDFIQAARGATRAGVRTG
jgi:phosphoribosylanthranilate isomerase